VIRACVVLNTASVRALHGSQQELERCFTDAEMAQLSSRTDPVPSLAARLAAKVATAAMLRGRADPTDSRVSLPGTGEPIDFVQPSRQRAADLCHIEVLVSRGGAPRLVLDPIAHPNTGPGLVSLSHDAGLAAALVVLDC
jgi:phosphopantetheinyl transferase (holo-ACP synthase)